MKWTCKEHPYKVYQLNFDRHHFIRLICMADKKDGYVMTFHSDYLHDKILMKRTLLNHASDESAQAAAIQLVHKYLENTIDSTQAILDALENQTKPE